jgi:hypothetical protein
MAVSTREVLPEHLAPIFDPCTNKDKVVQLTMRRDCSNVQSHKHGPRPRGHASAFATFILRDLHFSGAS